MAKLTSDPHTGRRTRTDLIGARVGFNRTDDAKTGEPKAYGLTLTGGDTLGRAMPRRYEITFTPEEWADIVSAWAK